jgi:hypothetical protein
MPDHELSTAAEVEAFIAQALESRGIPNAEARLVAAAVSPSLSEPPESTGPPGDDYLLLTRLRWAIKDDDLDLLGTLTAAALAAVGAGLLGGAMDRESQAKAVVAVALALFRTLRQIHRKSASLGTIDCAILVALKSSPNGLEASEVRAVLRSTGHKLTQKEIDRRLKALQQVRLRDGTTADFASLSALGRWSAAGL